MEADRPTINTLVAKLDVARVLSFVNRRGELPNPSLTVKLYHGDELQVEYRFGGRRGAGILASSSTQGEFVVIDESLFESVDVSLDELTTPSPLGESPMPPLPEQ
jgi:hypothetical protein